MESKKILFVSLNNGSDVRIRKELDTLSDFSKVTFYGISKIKNKNKNKKVNYINFERSYKNYFNLFLYIKDLVIFIFNNKFDNLHIVDEELYILLFLFLVVLKPIKRIYIILDIFDSIYLKNNLYPKHINSYLFKIYLSQIDQLILTDKKRHQLYPKNFKKIQNAIILENYPYRIDFENEKIIEKKLNIAYIGTLSKGRGSIYLKKLLEKNKNINIICMGIIYDQFTNNLLQNNKNIFFYGNLKTDEMNKILIKQAHYMFIYYPSYSLNNIYSSPNKIYDAINLNIPMLINNDTKSSDFVMRNNLGLIYDINKVFGDNQILDLIRNFNYYKQSLKQLKKLNIYNWNFIKYKLLNAHKICYEE